MLLRIAMSDIIIIDEIARRNLELARIARRNGGKGLGGLPFLDLDTKAYSDFREGRSSKPPREDADTYRYVSV